MPRKPISRLAPSSRRLRMLEKCEDRIVAAADFFFANDDTVDTAAATVTTQAEGHGWTDIDYIRTLYGLQGNNQAVAIIDSGIAYDHVALGGGLGAGRKVIGGWDFAENDANPYDDGPSGFHGTHVAGIVAANDGTYPGVAPGASLVGLRVFQDNGAGNFSWIENALRWVHDNRNSLGVQITTVNLSLGTDWNADNTPNWAMLEDEFATLKADGIFISVAAGNSFAKFNTPGLSYPATSPYVVPVSSIGAGDLFSKFSQRSARSIAAPGERIMSTVPDWFMGADGVKNDWSAASGTSMAAPYVAGASVLLREALTSFGRSANQDEIYNLMRNTATTIYDATTNANYLKLNLTAAMAALSGADEFGNSAGAAGSLGRVVSPTVSGKFNTLGDADYFTFVADKTGVLQFNGGNAGGGVQTWSVVGGATSQGNSLSLNVVAGQTYTIGLNSTTIGAYTYTTTFTGSEPVVPVTPPPVAPTPPTNPTPTPTPTPPPVTPAPPAAAPVIDWGAVESAVKNNLQNHVTTVHRLQAARTGLLTVEGMQTGGANVTVELLSADSTLITAATVVNGVLRIDANVNAGQTYLLKVWGVTSDLDLKLTNAANINSQGVLEVNGTGNSDRFDVDMGRGVVTINGTLYSFAGLKGVKASGGGGADTLNITGDSNSAERVTMGPGVVNITGGRRTVAADSMETIQAAMQRADNVSVQDSRGNDTLNVGWMAFSLIGGGYSLGVTGAGVTTINLTAGGVDTGNFSASAGTPTVNRLAGTVSAASGGAIVAAKGLEQGFYVTPSGLKARLNAVDVFHSVEFDADDVFTPIAGLNDAIHEVAAAGSLAATQSRVTIFPNATPQSADDSLQPTASNAALFENLDAELDVILAAATELQNALAPVIGAGSSAETSEGEAALQTDAFLAALDEVIV